MKYNSVFDIIGPIMIGPSSSHTAGAVRIGSFAREVFGKAPTAIKICFYGSFAETYQGHGTDVAVIGGILGFKTNNPNIPKSIEIAKKQGINIEFITSNDIAPHPNTAKLVISNDMEELTILGISIGGGSIEILSINNYDLDIKFNTKAFLLVHNKNIPKHYDINKFIENNNRNITIKDVSNKGVHNACLNVLYTKNNNNVNLINKIQDNNIRVIAIN